jgi:hypothetical protein
VVELSGEDRTVLEAWVRASTIPLHRLLQNIMGLLQIVWKVFGRF